ncbi:MAG: hypothetical protein KKF27_20525 [Gammaproteobacteria bacterium]|nr:hypothetical protein [Gammaproteobacteria bacterium]
MPECVNIIKSFTVTVTSGATQTDYVYWNNMDLGAFNALEALLVVDAPTGAGANPTLDVTLAGSLDSDYSANTVSTIISFTQVTTSASTQIKVRRRTWTGGSEVIFGRHIRLTLAGDCDAGADKVYTGTLYLMFMKD